MIYFVSDAHLGSRIVENPREHELQLVRWLDKVKEDAEAIYLLGDMFDFWFEYRTVVPKGFVRFLGKLAELVDSGIEIHFFIGNHDIWTFGYLENEVGLIVHREPLVTEIKGKKFYMAHGDGLFTGEKKFNIIRKIFHNPISQELFRLLPPLIGQKFGYAWSKNNREKILSYQNKFEGEENEHIVVFAKKYAEKNDVDFMVFGHRHIELNLELKNKSRVIILGDFIDIFSYGVFDGKDFWLERFSPDL
ncbi:MAG: UDP-2,3-diacylglucosamine diphosphatase [Porphyromonadaceae bacterium]|jgi:UDP-2,3-diacylglucosamine hydrolase|nr:UDP-2,3-diacylglucosamine diphosphatase [Porphyromonadaceae bacterium]